MSVRLCTWCARGRIYDDGTKCAHGPPPVECRIHGGLTDLNLVARGRRACVKCAHYGHACVALYADPIGDDREHGSYSIIFSMVGVGHEVYQIPPGREVCPHYVFDKVVAEMRAGQRPRQSRVPDPSTRSAEPGKALEEDHG